jgi:hypothetical protein
MGMPNRDEKCALVGLAVFAAWVFMVLPLITAWQAYQFAHPAGYSQPYERSDNADAHEGRESKLGKTFWEKTEDDPTAYFTLWLMVFTGVLATSTMGLWAVTWRSSVRQSRDMQSSIDVATKAANASERQANVLIAVEAPMPIVVAIKLAQYSQIPGQTVVVDPLPPGPIQPNCRVFFVSKTKVALL